MVTHRIPNSAAVEYRDGDKPIITGYGAVFYDGSEGTQYRFFGFLERIMPGAFDRAVKDDDVRGLFNHDPNEVLGRTKAGTMRLSVDSHGLRYEIDPPASAGKVIEAIRRRDVTGSSFGFEVLGEEFRKEDGETIREITEVRLFDTGPVTYPAYTGTEAEARDIRSRMDSFQKRLDQDRLILLRLVSQ